MKAKLTSMQVTVPRAEYGACQYFMPSPMENWLNDKNLKTSMVGRESYGNGYTNGVTNRTTTYMIRNIEATDATAFQLMFPKCKIHLGHYDEYPFV
jgi:hypothetical protein